MELRQQLFDEDDATELVSAISFDHTGDFVAVGDKGGQVSIFSKDSDDEYVRMGTFRSHEPEFDYLKSLEIEEKINKIKWLRRCNDSHFVITTNDKTIKLWKTGQREQKVIQPASPKTGSLVVPKVVASGDAEFYYTPRRIFANAHAYHINSISINSDQETYISSDDLRINLWNLDISDQSFNIVDIKPPNMEELTEVITSAEFHPIHCNHFMYSSSKGTIKLCDMREAALCDESAKVFEEEEDPSNKSFFSEIISSISDIKFSNDGRFILARDYMTLKVWDLAMEREPVKTVAVHDYLKTKLCDLYENDCIFDKFECTLSHDARRIVTGSYGHWFYMHDMETGRDERVEVNRKGAKGFKMKFGKHKARDAPKINPDTIAFDKKCTQVAYHPSEDLIAIGAGSNVALYSVQEDAE